MICCTHLGVFNMIQIIYPKNQSHDELFAAKEITFWLKKALKTKIKCVADCKYNKDNKSKFISVGNTKMFNDSKIIAPKLSGGSFLLKSQGESLFIIADSDSGITNGAYELLHDLIGFETYGPEVSVFNKKDNQLDLSGYDKVYTPDIACNVATVGFLFKVLPCDKFPMGILDEKLSKRMRFSSWNWMMVNGKDIWHNSFIYLPPSVHMKDHPKWYNEEGLQLCYTAHGDEKEFESMVKTALEVLKENLRTDRTSTRVTFTQEDFSDQCNCQACVATKEKYGTQSAAIIKFINELDKGVIEWFETEEGAPYKRDLDICFFAYADTVKAPVKNENGKFYPIDETVRLSDNVCVYFAPIFNDYKKPLNDENNKEVYETLLKWNSISKKLYMWTYNSNFHNYLAPFDSFSAMGETYKSLANVGTAYLFAQDQYSTVNPTGFTTLKTYLSSKLGWNTKENVSNLIDDFFANYYTVSSKQMRECFELLRQRLDEAYSKYNFGHYIYDEPLDKNIFTKEFLLKSLNIIEQALLVINTNKEISLKEKRRLRKAIVLESLSYQYLLIALYRDDFKNDLIKMKKKFKKDVKITNLSQAKEGRPIKDLFKEWKI